MMTPIWLFLAVAFILALCLLLLVVEINRLRARAWMLERRMENAHVSIATHCGQNPHNHTAVVSFPTPTRKTQ